MVKKLRYFVREGERVYRRGNVYKGGDPVPEAQAYPTWADALVLAGKLRVEEYEDDSVDLEDSLFPLEANLYSANVGQVQEFINNSEDIDILEDIARVEEDNPNYSGGRKGVLDAVDERIDELTEEE